MTISSQTTQQAYQLNKGGARARLNPGDWKAARHYTLANWQNAYISGLHQGSDSWHTHDGEQFRCERDASSILGKKVIFKPVGF